MEQDSSETLNGQLKLVHLFGEDNSHLYTVMRDVLLIGFEHIKQAIEFIEFFIITTVTTRSNSTQTRCCIGRSPNIPIRIKRLSSLV